MVAQLLPKQWVAGSNPVSRSRLTGALFRREWLDRIWVGLKAKFLSIRPIRLLNGFRHRWLQQQENIPHARPHYAPPDEANPALALIA